jgi:hypothetical protein
VIVLLEYERGTLFELGFDDPVVSGVAAGAH